VSALEKIASETTHAPKVRRSELARRAPPHRALAYELFQNAALKTFGFGFEFLDAIAELIE
jgi:hypothetical protein